ncbi:MAG: hypothetical protein ACREXY_22785, partial [Gammaproteobacteria bacterium]
RLHCPTTLSDQRFAERAFLMAVFTDFRAADFLAAFFAGRFIATIFLTAFLTAFFAATLLVAFFTNTFFAAFFAVDFFAFFFTAIGRLHFHLSYRIQLPATPAFQVGRFGRLPESCT